MSPGRTAVPEEIQDLVAEAGDVLLQLLQRDGEREREQILGYLTRDLIVKRSRKKERKKENVNVGLQFESQISS